MCYLRNIIALLLLLPLVSVATIPILSTGTTSASGEPDPPTEHPNEPEGATLIEDRPFLELDEDGWADSNGSTAVGAYLTLENGIMRHTFPAGHSGNGSSSQCSTNDYAGWGATTHVYLHYRIRYSANWYGQDGSAVNKMLYIGNDGSAIPIVLDAHGAGSGALRFMIAMQGGSTENLEWDDDDNEVSPSASDAEIVRGEWTEIELLLVINTPGSANGQVHGWVNGVKTHQFTNKNIYASGANLSNQILHIRPIYGGQNGSNVPADQYLEFDLMYLSTL